MLDFPHGWPKFMYYRKVAAALARGGYFFVFLMSSTTRGTTTIKTISTRESISKSLISLIPPSTDFPKGISM